MARIAQGSAGIFNAGQIDEDDGVGDSENIFDHNDSTKRHMLDIWSVLCANTEAPKANLGSLSLRAGTTVDVDEGDLVGSVPVAVAVVA